MSATTTKHPFTSYSFQVKIGDSNTVAAYFSEVSGLGGEIDVDEYKEGGVNGFVHKLPRNAKYNNLVLKAGMSEKTVLYDWFENTANNKVKLKTITISLIDPKDRKTPIKTWIFKKAFPVKISATDLNAQNSEIIIEQVEFAHSGMILQNEV